MDDDIAVLDLGRSSQSRRRYHLRHQSHTHDPSILLDPVYHTPLCILPLRLADDIIVDPLRKQHGRQSAVYPTGQQSLAPCDGDEG